MTDLLITGGTVVDGTGAAGRRADVAVTGGRITAIGDLRGRTAARTLDATGHVVCPGFVDVHTHSDLTLLSAPDAHSAVRQGVTTAVVGNCGLGAAPLPPGADVPAIRAAVGYLDLDPDVAWTWDDLPGYRAALAAARPSVNVGTLVAHLPLRAGVVGFGDRAAGPGELDRMCGLLGDALDAGAVGLSTGLVYAPLCYAREEELVALGRVVAAHGGLFAWHARDYADDLRASVRQVVRVAAASGCRAQISHLVAVGRRNWGSVARALEIVDAARAGGVDVAADVYPYLAGNAPLSQLLPAWAQDGGAAAMRARLTDPSVRARIAEEWRDRPLGWPEITISRVPEDTAHTTATDTTATHGTAAGGGSAGGAADTGGAGGGLAGGAGGGIAGGTGGGRAGGAGAGVLGGPGGGIAGRTVAELAGGGDPDALALDLLAAYGNAVLMVAGGRSEEDLLAALAHPATVIGSDGQALDPDGPTGAGVPHPRSYGCYPRLFGTYVRGGRLPLADAVRKCTGAPARRLGLRDRGELRTGAAADIVVFSPAEIADQATFASPQRYPTGVRHVLVNGSPVIVSGRHTGARPGSVLRPDPS